nr:hypothetical protein [Tanacetum cinerariifolium]
IPYGRGQRIHPEVEGIATEQRSSYCSIQTNTMRLRSLTLEGFAAMVVLKVFTGIMALANLDAIEQIIGQLMLYNTSLERWESDIKDEFKRSMRGDEAKEVLVWREMALESLESLDENVLKSLG